MKRVFNAEIIWDTDDEKGLILAVDELIQKLSEIEEIEAITPHVYPENPIVIILKK
jgi:hypothetical protein